MIFANPDVIIGENNSPTNLPRKYQGAPCHLINLLTRYSGDSVNTYYYTTNETCYPVGNVNSQDYVEADGRLSRLLGFPQQTLYNEFQDCLNFNHYKPTEFQEEMVRQILEHLSLSFLRGIKIVLSADEEIVIVKENQTGFHYILIDRLQNELIYVLSPKSEESPQTTEFSANAVGAAKISSYFVRA